MKPTGRGRNIAIVDTIGVHSGLQHYDQALASALMQAGFQVDLVSNFDVPRSGPSRPPVLQNFYRGGPFRKLGRLACSFLSYLVYVLLRATRKERWWIFSSFGLRWVDLLFLLPLLPLRHRLIILIHDVFSITSPEGPFTRWLKIWFYRKIPKHVIVHSSESRRVLEDAGYRGVLLETPTFPTAIHATIDPAHLGDDIRRAVDLGDRLPLLFFGSLRPSKGLDVALAALRSLPDSVRSRMHLIVAGRDSAGLLETPSYEIGLDLPVTILNRFVSDEEQSFLFQHCKLLLLPYREIYQSGVIEVAITYRVPFLGSSLPTFRNTVASYPSFGFIYGDSPEQLAYYLERFGAKPDLLSQMYQTADLEAYAASIQREEFVKDLRLLANLTPPVVG